MCFQDPRRLFGRAIQWLLCASVLINMLLLMFVMFHQPDTGLSSLTGHLPINPEQMDKRDLHAIIQEKGPKPHIMTTDEIKRLKDLKDNKEWEKVQQVPTEKPIWSYNKTAADVFRRELDDICNTKEDFIVTKENFPLGSVIQYDAERHSRLNVTSDVWERFPQSSPFAHMKHSRCSVVGNSGLLKNSNCGKEIDAADFVFRCNMAPIDGHHIAEVGSKTNLITANPTIIRDKYKNFRNQTLKENFVKDLSVYGKSYIWMTPFAYKMCTSYTFKAQHVLKEFKSDNEIIFANPVFMGNMNKYWKKHGVKAWRASTGLFLVSAALSMCEEVHLYGFWPWHLDRLGNNLTQHYYDNHPVHKAHKLPDEFQQHQKLHNEGVLHMTTNRCA
ncbi:alpha-N-acetylneuraminide alpha-2,8-sialyltransferase-like isoform X1 [Branchiostoma floridae x Branchiostoma belcheri]